MPVNVGPMELIIVLVIALIVLGPKRLPEAGRAVGLGQALRAQHDERDDQDDDQFHGADVDWHSSDPFGAHHQTVESRFSISSTGRV